MNVIPQAIESKGIEIFKLTVYVGTLFDETKIDKYILKPIKTNSLLVNLFRNVTYRLKMAIFFFWSLLKFDTYILFGFDNFLPFYLDFIILKILRKKVVIMFLGDDIRYRKIYNEISANYGLVKLDTNNGDSFLSKLWITRLPEWLGVKVVSIVNQSTLSKKPFIFFKFPQPKLRSDIKIANDTPIIIHAPSDRRVKATETVIKAMEILDRYGVDFEFRLLEKVDNSTILRNLSEADLCIDQPSSWCGKLAIEACASGCCVIGGNIEEYENPPFRSPIIQFKNDPKLLANSIRVLIENRSLRQKKMNECYFFWNEHYSFQAYKSWFLNVLNGTNLEYSELPQDLINLRRNYLGKVLSKF